MPLARSLHTSLVVAANPQAAPLGVLAKRGVGARNGMLVAGMATLAVGDLFFAFMHSPLGATGEARWCSATGQLEHASVSGGQQSRPPVA